MVFLILTGVILVSKLFRAYGLYNVTGFVLLIVMAGVFQSSFELTGYITNRSIQIRNSGVDVSKLFRAYRLYNSMLRQKIENSVFCFKALSSLRVI